MNIRRAHFISLLLLSLLAACAAPVSTNIKPSEASVAKYGNMSDLNVVAALEKSVNDAKASGMPFLAPSYYKEATQVLSECQNQLGGKQRDQLVAKAAKGDAILEKGRAVMDVVKYRFASELDLKNQLDAHDTAKLLPKDYEQVIGRLSGLIVKVEREQTGNIDKDKELVQKALLDLLIRAVQEGALHESEAINAESRKKHADQQAPLTFAEAQKVYDDAKKQIAANHHDDKLVLSLGAKALFAAKHAQQVNDRVAALQSQLNFTSGSGSVGMGVGAGGSAGGAQLSMQSGGGRAGGTERQTLEKIVLQEEERLQSIARALGLADLRDRSQEKQAEEIQRAATEVSSKSKSDETIKELREKLTAADESAQQAAAQLAAKDKQMAEKNSEIKRLNERLTQPAVTAKPKTIKPKAVKPQQK